VRWGRGPLRALAHWRPPAGLTGQPPDPTQPGRKNNRGRHPLPRASTEGDRPLGRNRGRRERESPGGRPEGSENLGLCLAGNSVGRAKQASRGPPRGATRLKAALHGRIPGGAGLRGPKHRSQGSHRFNQPGRRLNPVGILGLIFLEENGLGRARFTGSKRGGVAGWYHIRAEGGGGGGARAPAAGGAANWELARTGERAPRAFRDLPFCFRGGAALETGRTATTPFFAGNPGRGARGPGTWGPPSVQLRPHEVLPGPAGGGWGALPASPVLPLCFVVLGWFLLLCGACMGAGGDCCSAPAQNRGEGGGKKFPSPGDHACWEGFGFHVWFGTGPVVRTGGNRGGGREGDTFLTGSVEKPLHEAR